MYNTHRSDSMNQILKTLSKYIEKNNYLAFSLAYMIMGCLIIIFNNRLFSSIVEIILFLMLLLCIKDLGHVIFKKKWSHLTFLKVCITLIVLLAYLNPGIPSALAIMTFASYLLLNGAAKLFSFYLQKKDKTTGLTKELIESLIFLIYGILCFFSPVIHMDVMLFIIGSYLILMGLNYLFDFLDEKNIHIRHIRFPLPVIVDAFIPFSILQKLNHIGEKSYELDLQKKDEDVDLEIFVHVSEKGFGKFGHVDLCFLDQVISYGNYDKDTRKLREGIGSGVVFTTSKNDYIRFCITHSEKTLFGFGIKLNATQKKKVQKELEKIKSDLIEWEPCYLRDLKAKKKIKKDDYKDYASMLYKNTKAKFYKFKTGKLKTYFILGNNCGTLVDKILKSSGAEVLKMYGIITPGTYYDFLEREYMKKGSNVVSKKIYHKGNIDSLEK